jgi:hypothetical protein
MKNNSLAMGQKNMKLVSPTLWMEARSLQMELINFINIKYSREIKELKGGGICCKRGKRNGERESERIMKTN